MDKKEERLQELKIKIMLSAGVIGLAGILTIIYLLLKISNKL